MLLKRSLIKHDMVDQAKSLRILTQLKDHKLKEQSLYNYLSKPKKKKRKKKKKKKKKKNFINVSKSLAYNGL